MLKLPLCLIEINYDTEKYYFVNLTKGHVCKCRFNNYEETIQDLENEISLGNVNFYMIHD